MYLYEIKMNKQLLIQQQRKIIFLKWALKRQKYAKSYGRHLTAYYIPSHLPYFKLCKPGMQVNKGHVCICYVNIVQPEVMSDAVHNLLAYFCPFHAPLISLPMLLRELSTEN